MSAKAFIQRLDQYCPPWLAEEGDPVGLHIGTLNKEISKVVITLDVRPEVVSEAIAAGVDLIIAKHPPIYRPLKRLLTDDPQTKMYRDLLAYDIAVYAVHTNMDIVENGLNDWFCQKLGIQETSYMSETHQISYLKLVTYVPSESAESVRQAMSKAGAGKIGSYQECSFTTTGEGRFKATKASEPFVGESNRLTSVSEQKIEVSLLETDQESIVQALLAAHPYETPVYQLSPIINQSKKFGLGRVGEIAESLPLSDFVQQVKKTFNLDGLRLIATDPERLVKRIAICGGSGEKFYRDALKIGADVYVTGDVSYHTGHDMLAEGLAVIDPGHHIEVLCQSHYLQMFEEWKVENNWNITFIESQVDTNPFRYY